MPSEREKQRLIDIRDHIVLAQSFVTGMTFEQFTADRKTVFAVVWCLEIVSEASRHIGSEVKGR